MRKFYLIICSSKMLSLSYSVSVNPLFEDKCGPYFTHSFQPPYSICDPAASPPHPHLTPPTGNTNHLGLVQYLYSKYFTAEDCKSSRPLYSGENENPPLFSLCRLSSVCHFRSRTAWSAVSGPGDSVVRSGSSSTLISPSPHH